MAIRGTGPKLVEATLNLDPVIAITRVSKTVMPVMVPTGPVFNEKIVVFPSNDTALLGLLSSSRRP